MARQEGHQSLQSFNARNPSSFKILNDTIEITTTILNFLVNATERLEGFGLTNGTPMILENDLAGIITNLKNQGKKIRYVTEINKDNLAYCKMMNQVLELRHADKINGAILVNDKEYLSIIESKKIDSDESLLITPTYLYSNNEQLVDQQHQLFEILWEKAIPAIYRINQIEEKRENQKEGFGIIHDKQKSLDLYKRVINEAIEEIIVFYYASNDSDLQTLKELTDMIRQITNDTKNTAKVKIKIIVSTEKAAAILKALELKLDDPDKIPNFQIKHINKYNGGDGNDNDHSLISSKNMVMLIADKREVLITETNFKTDRENKERGGGGGLDNTLEYTLHSTSPSITYAYKIILDKLWKQNDLYKMLEAANMKLELQEAMQQELIHNFANGLKNPVQPLLGFSEILLSKKGDLSDYKDILKVIRHYSQKLTIRVNNVINAIEIDNGRYSIRKESFNILDLLDQLLSYHCNNSFYNYNISYKVNYENNKISPMVYADKNKIKLLIDNILINAIDQAKAKKLHISVINHRRHHHQRKDNFLSNEDKSDRIEIRITDDGKGTDDLILEDMFSKYKTNSDDGLGLGLYLAKSIIEAHGGQIWAQNNKAGKGTTISFYLPVN